MEAAVEEAATELEPEPEPEPEPEVPQEPVEEAEPAAEAQQSTLGFAATGDGKKRKRVKKMKSYMQGKYMGEEAY